MKLHAFGWLALAVALTTADTASAQQPPSAATVASMLLEPRHGMSVADWRTLTPLATWYRYRGTYELVAQTDAEPSPHGVDLEGFWCVVATDQRAFVERAVVFYALRDARPFACRIEHVQGVTRYLTRQEAETLFRETSTAMTRTLGIVARVARPNDLYAPPPYDVNRSYPKDGPGWEEAATWHQSDRDLSLFRSAEAVGFSSRSTLLTPKTAAAGQPTDVVEEAERRLTNSLRPGFPKAATAMSYGPIPEEQPVIRGALNDLLDARATASPEELPLLTFAADRLARRLWIVRPPPVALHRELTPLRRRGLRFVEDPYNELWIYDGALMRAVLQQWRETEWGQTAFVTHLYSGYTETVCDETAYKQVIRQGNAWLLSHHDSPWRIAAVTAVARAYETQWAWNGTFTADAQENARSATRVVAAARLSAIRLYEDVIRLAPASPDAAYARRRIIQIRANMTTSQDAYTCLYP